MNANETSNAQKVINSIKKAEGLTSRQFDILQTTSEYGQHTGRNYAGSPHSVYEALGEKGLVTWDSGARPQHRRYRLTPAGYEAMRPWREYVATVRKTMRDADEAARKETEQAAAQKSLGLDLTKAYHVTEEMDAEIRSVLGIDKLERV